MLYEWNNEKELIAFTFGKFGKDFHEAAHLAQEDFEDPHLGAIWEAIKATMKPRWAFTEITEGEIYKTLSVKARAYVRELAALDPLPGSVKFYAREIKAAANLRHAKTLATLANEITLENRAQKLKEIRQLEALLETSPDQQPKTEEQSFIGWQNRLHEAPNYLETNSPSLDEKIKGWQPGGLYILAARPGIGKTAVALNLIWLLRERAKTCFYSLEMPAAQIYARLASIATGWQHSEIDKTISPQTAQVLARDFTEPYLASGIQVIAEPAGFTMNSLRAHAIKQKAEGNLDFLVIDQLDKIRGDRNYPGDYERFTAHSTALKQLALELDVPLLLLCQINREGDEVPALTHLKSSGQLEQDGDLVLLLHRKGEPSLGEVDLVLNVAKNRHGKTGLIRYRWQGDNLRLTDPAAQTYIPEAFFTATSGQPGRNLSAGTAI